MVAPFQGYVGESRRAGDSVRAGQMLARLDDRDLKLERALGLGGRADDAPLPPGEAAQERSR